MAAPSVSVPSWREVMGSGRARLTAGLALTEFVAGMQALVVVSAMPKVLSDLGGVEFYGTVFSGYMVSGLVSIPLAGRAADREGPTKPFVRNLLVFALGTVLCVLAPSMPLLALARVVQGYGGGAVYTIAYGVIAKAYPSPARPRMLAVLTFTWVVSGLIAPSIGAILATTVGWRWVFVVVLPLLLLAGLLTVPGMAGIGGEAGQARVSPRWPVVLAAASGLGLFAASNPRWWSIPLAAAAVLAAFPALQRLMPRGWLRAAAGAPSAVTLNLLLYLAFFTADSFVTLLLTGVRGVSVAEAGVAVTLVSISWAAGSWWQSRAITRWSPALLTFAGSAVFVAGTACMAALLAGAPLLLGYIGWTVAGAGVGVAFPTIMLASMDYADRGDETSAMAARFVSGRMGIILGTGLAGAAIAVSHDAGRPLAWGLSAVFALALAGGVACAAASGRLRAPG
ncbi:MAG TPA: MFS transporter [Candidatus Angelobacter sp.]|jgi:MFS family permease|nr:MFS transporter [Candidatus Angelobacter sp.]